jgi:hypothetical protein
MRLKVSPNSLLVVITHEHDEVPERCGPKKRKTEDSTPPAEATMSKTHYQRLSKQETISDGGLLYNYADNPTEYMKARK